ncbi:hypothetical protein BJ085DRAFT_41131 [Dimargaris cristalligena]|uniref:Uncharacterized protein n=1 Tax=Dimargaris cristalligena TaxID=215637 RepID=A0A4P9ZRS2_9FUNG|nr:hypothetical protein BJ085DRAFT_41131 [Dimargaris cristalligena]|eukprot:RKP35352.1 hypothetical protein BJ085DRAFT_41131 [Dimargaris cristalligena]
MSDLKLSGGIVAITCLLSFAVPVATTDQYSNNPAQVTADPTAYGVGDVHPTKGLVSWAQSPGKPRSPPVDSTDDQYHLDITSGRTPPPPPSSPFLQSQSGEGMASTRSNHQAVELVATYGDEDLSITTYLDSLTHIAFYPDSTEGAQTDHQDHTFSSQNYPANPMFSVSFGESDNLLSYDKSETVNNRKGEQPFPITAPVSSIRKIPSNQIRQGFGGGGLHSCTPKKLRPKALTLEESIITCAKLSKKAFSQGYPRHIQKEGSLELREFLRKYMFHARMFSPTDHVDLADNIKKLSKLIKINQLKMESPSLIYALEWNAKLQTIVPYFFTGEQGYLCEKLRASIGKLLPSVRYSSIPIFGTPDDMEKAFKEAIAVFMANQAFKG